MLVHCPLTGQVHATTSIHLSRYETQTHDTTNISTTETEPLNCIHTHIHHYSYNCREALTLHPSSLAVFILHFVYFLMNSSVLVQSRFTTPTLGLHSIVCFREMTQT